MLTELTWNHIAVLNIIAQNTNKQTYVAVLAIPTIAQGTNLATRTVRRLVADLENLGYLNRKILHGVMPTRYRLMAKTCEMLYT